MNTIGAGNSTQRLYESTCRDIYSWYTYLF